MPKFLLSLLLTLGVFSAAVSAQTAEAPQQRPVPVPGEVTAIDAANNRIQLKAKDGSDVSVALDEKTVYKRVSPDNPTDLKSATPVALTDISIGDSVVAVGMLSGDKKTVAQTRSVYLMTKADISKKQETEQQKWANGFIGKITAINPANNEVTISLRGSMPEKSVVVATNNQTKFHRYAANSVKFSDAVASNFGELKVGDTLRARGEKAADGSRLAADEVVSGSFRMVAGTITAIDTAKNQITVKEANTNKIVVVEVNSNTLLRRFPPEMAQRLAMFQAMRASGQMQGMPMGGGNGGGAAGQQRPMNPDGGQGARGGAGQGMGGGGGMMRGGGDVDQMLERLPALTLSELKVGDAIAASSTAGASPDHFTAVKFVAGVEAFLNPPQIPGGNRSQGVSSPSINIPGLDSLGTP